MARDTIPIIHNKTNQQFEVSKDGHKAELVYRMKGEEIYLMHTTVPKEIGNQGIAKALTIHSLTYALDKRYKIIAYCPYVRAYMQKHPDWRNELS